MEPEAERHAFLRQRVPSEYAPLRPAIQELQKWLQDPNNLATRDVVASKRALVGLEDPEGATPIPDLQRTVECSSTAIKADPNNAAAYFMLARAMTELGRYDDVTYHPVPLRDSIDFAERSTQLAPRVGKAWRALIEASIHLNRDEMVTVMLNDLGAGGFAPGTHATLSAKYAEARTNFDEAIDWYERSLGYIAEPVRRAETYAAEAFCLIKMKKKSEAERPFLLALLEAGPSVWIGHNWSVLKSELGNLVGATELNRRVLTWDWNYAPAIELKNFLVARYTRNNQAYPGPVALQEEQLRGIALPGCDPAILQQLNVEEWKPPRRGTRARATRTFRHGLE